MRSGLTSWLNSKITVFSTYGDTPANSYLNRVNGALLDSGLNVSRSGHSATHPTLHAPCIAQK